MLSRREIVIEGLLADFPTTSREVEVVVASVAEETAAVECAMPSREASAIAATAADSATKRVARMQDTLAPITAVAELAPAMPSREESAPEVTLAASLTAVPVAEEVAAAVESATPSREASAIAALPASSPMMVRDLAPSALPALLAFATPSRRESATAATPAASLTSSVMCLRLPVLLVLVECAMLSREESASVARSADSVTRALIKSSAVCW